MATAVFFHAHPDDEAIATAGTMRLASDAGHRVVLVLATRGELGEPVDGVLAEGERLADRREQEVRRVGELLGAQRVEFLGYHDSGMMGEATNDDPSSFWQADVDVAAEQLADILRDESADVLSIYDDHGGYGHPDHIQVHRVGVRAATLAGVGRVYEATMNRDQVRRTIDEAEAAGAAEDDLLEQREMIDTGPFGLPESEITHAIDVSSVLDAKRGAMFAHESQIAPDSFFVAMPAEQFGSAFGTEWYRRHGEPRNGEALETDLFA